MIGESVDGGDRPDRPFIFRSCDSGRGIPQESLPLVFERLYQDPDAVDGNRAGLGLGLYIAKEIVTLHGGRMWVASQPGSGSTFSFTLPLYSLAKLLLPVITLQGRLREAIVLVRVELTPLSKRCAEAGKKPASAVWSSCAVCIYVDKDLVLPPIGNSGPVETFFVVASTDMEQVNIMMDRIRGQVGALPQLKASGTLRVTAEMHPRPAGGGPEDPGTTSLGCCRLRHRNHSARIYRANTTSHRKGETHNMRTESNGERATHESSQDYGRG